MSLANATFGLAMVELMGANIWNGAAEGNPGTLAGGLAGQLGGMGEPPADCCRGSGYADEH